MLLPLAVEVEGVQTECNTAGGNLPFSFIILLAKRQGRRNIMFSLNCAFCNLRFRFRFLDVPLGIKSKLIIVFNFLHLAPKTSANKPASRGYTMASRNPIKGMLRQSGALLIGICSPRRNKGRPKLEGVGYTSCLPISFTLSRYRLNPINDERALFLSFFSFLITPPPPSKWVGGTMGPQQARLSAG